MSIKETIRAEIEREMGEITSGGGEPNDDYTFCGELLAILDSLPEQPAWKFSEEQMEALERCIEYLEESDNEDADILAGLYNQIKKLGVKEEPEYYQHFDPDC